LFVVVDFKELACEITPFFAHGQIAHTQKVHQRKRLAITASLSSQKALPYEKNYYLHFVGAKVLPKMHTASKNCIKKG
jgi:hypothetical protein